jgi:hypothetical protein
VWESWDDGRVSLRDLFKIRGAKGAWLSSEAGHLLMVSGKLQVVRAVFEDGAKDGAVFVGCGVSGEELSKSVLMVSLQW